MKKKLPQSDSRQQDLPNQGPQKKYLPGDVRYKGPQPTKTALPHRGYFIITTFSTPQNFT